MKVTDLEVAQRLVRTNTSANSRNIEFSLSFKKLKSLLSTKRCYFTNNLLDFDNSEHPNYHSLDRLDSSKGYTDDNVVACGRLFNMRKSNLSPEEITLMYEGLKKKKLI